MGYKKKPSVAEKVKKEAYSDAGVEHKKILLKLKRALKNVGNKVQDTRQYLRITCTARPRKLLQRDAKKH